MRTPASRSNGTQRHPCAQFIRFTEEENRRLHRLVKKRKVTIQAFAHAAILRAINEAEQGRETDAEAQKKLLEAYTLGREKERATPVGLGIRERIEEMDLDRHNSRDVSRSTPSVVEPIRREPLSFSPRNESEISTLARSVVGTPRPHRTQALESAVQALAHGRRQEEALLLAEELDREIKRLDGEPKSALEKVRARRAMNR